MRSSLYTLRLLLGLLTFTLLVACADSGKAPSPAPKEQIDTQHLYLDNNKIYSFNASTGTSRERGSYSNNIMAFSLNTNEDKQGYEYLAYVNDNDVFIMNYVSTNITQIANPANTICGIFPSYAASQLSFEDRLKQRILIHQPVVIIAIANGLACDNSTNSLYRATFDPDGVDGISITTINSALANLAPETHQFGVNVLDFTYSGTEIENGKTVNVKGRSGFLGYDQAGDQVQLYNQNNVLLWAAQLPEDDSNTNLRALGSDIILIQSNDKLFIRKPNNLFEAANLGETNTDIPLNNTLETLFNIESFLLTSNDNPIKTANNDLAFYFKDGNSIHYFNGQNIIHDIYTVDESSESLTRFDITNTNILILHKAIIEAGTGRQVEILSLIDPEIGTVSELTEFDDAKKIEFHVASNDLYVNTLNANGQTGWQAHRYEVTVDGINKTSYDNSMFVIVNDTRSQDATILLLSSNETSLQPMQKPALYAFNPNKVKGRGLKYGQLNSDVSLAHVGSHESEVINDIYGRLMIDASFEAVETTETYFFNPTQANSKESSFSLQLIKREVK